MKNILTVVLIIAGVFLFLAIVPSQVMAAAKTVSLVTYYPAPSGAYGSLRSDHACVGDDCAATVVNSNDFRVKGKVDAAALKTTGNVNAQMLEARSVTANNASIAGQLAAKTATVTGDISANSFLISETIWVTGGLNTTGNVDANIIKANARIDVPELGAKTPKLTKGSFWLAP